MLARIARQPGAFPVMHKAGVVEAVLRLLAGVHAEEQALARDGSVCSAEQLQLQTAAVRLLAHCAASGPVGAVCIAQHEKAIDILLEVGFETFKLAT